MEYKTFFLKTTTFSNNFRTLSNESKKIEHEVNSMENKSKSKRTKNQIEIIDDSFKNLVFPFNSVTISSSHNKQLQY